MPPRKKRGGTSGRGKRGRPAKKVMIAETQPDLIEITETSSSNSPLMEEAPAQAETKMKLETKIHKKFGIKYHVPEVEEAVILPASSQSPIAEDTQNPSIQAEALPITNIIYQDEAIDCNMTRSDVERMDIDSSTHLEGQVEDEISEQLNQLEVVEDQPDTLIVQEVHYEPESSIVLQCDNILSDSVILEGGSDLMGNNEDSAEDTVYYLLEESNDATEYLQTQDEVQETDNKHVEEVECNQEIMEERQEIVQNKPELLGNNENSQEVTQEEVKMETEKHAEQTIAVLDEMPKEEFEMVKSHEKPCRKSKRISLKEGKNPEELPIVTTTTHEGKAEVESISISNQELTSSSNETESETRTTPILDLDEESPKDEAVLYDLQETLDSTIEDSLNNSEVNDSDSKDAGKRKKTKKTSTMTKATIKRTSLKEKDKDIHKLKEKEDKQKKSKKPVTLKVQSKARKGKELKISQYQQKSDEDDLNVRRSSRIKTISTLKVRSRGKGLVKKDDTDLRTAIGQCDDKNVFVAPTSTTDAELKPVKVKSRWRRSSELEMRDTVKAPTVEVPGSTKDESRKNDLGEVEKRLKQFVHLRENVYLTERISCKEAKKMLCDCFLTQEEIDHGEYGCGDDCLNRLLMIECGNLCTVGERCTNKRFQKLHSAPVEAFATERKGLGIRAISNIPSGEFILEYVGEVLDPDKFEKRAGEYSQDKNQHYYFMSLRADAIIDATMKGNISRFINHSCEPNAETQKWTVNGELRIGFFSKRTILSSEEITFDYQFQRYGKEAQKCFCEAPTCRGWLGEEPDDEDDDDEDEDEEEEDEEVEEQELEQNLDLDQAEKDDKDSQTVKPLQVAPKVVKKEKTPKKEKKPRELRARRKTRMDRYEDLGIDDEIESLQLTGLKNQAQTLKLSRLMVRAKEPMQRTRLLKLLKKGEFPCRRLFLDYHGLRLIHGWMTDAQHLAKEDPSMESLRLEILQTLVMLPIPNKTMLQDSKVLPMVEKWAVKQTQESPNDSEVNSPNNEGETPKMEDTKVEENQLVAKSSHSQSNPTISITSTSSSTWSNADKDKAQTEEEEIRKSNGFEPTFVKLLPDYNGAIKEELMMLFADDFIPLEMPAKMVKAPEPPQPKYDVLEEITALALKLLEEWASLKEVFRIPKKERIEQMKEHEREADRRGKALSVEQDTERRRDRYRGFQRHFRIEVTSNKDRMNMNMIAKNAFTSSHSSKMNKFERRELFARQVEQAEEEERRRKQQEMWKNYMTVGQDPRMPVPFDPNRTMQCVWNAQLGQWQNIPVQDPNLPAWQFSRPNMEAPHGIQALQPAGMLPPNVIQPNMPAASMGTMPPMPNIPPGPAGMPYQDDSDPAKVQFMGPIPPPAKLPPKWKTANDKYGRPYYYHVKFRKAQWIPPEVAEEEPEGEESESSSSSDTSSLTSSSSSEDSDSDDIDDTRLMLEIRKKFTKLEAEQKAMDEKTIQPLITTPNEFVELPGLGGFADPILDINDINICVTDINKSIFHLSDIDKAKEKSIVKDGSPQEAQITEPPLKKRRVGLVQEVIISPRSEEDRLQFREDVKKYRQNKEMVRKQKEIVLKQTKKHMKATSSTNLDKSKDKEIEKEKEEKPPKKVSTKEKLREMEANSNSEESKRIKEAFRASMATVMVSILNPFRKSDCKEGRISTTEDFKHLARKLTHFVMLKELKHCDRIEDLECTESVKVKAKEFVRKYMAKFGELYQKPTDEIDNF